MNILRSDGIKYRELANVLLEDIESGELKAGDIIPSETRLQEQYSVSRITVRHAVNLLVAEGWLHKERGRGKGTIVLKKDEASSKFRKGLSIGIFLGYRYLYSDRSDMPDIISGMINKLNFWESNLNVFPVLSKIDHFEYIKSIIARNVIDGIFLATLGSYAENENVIKYLIKRNFPFVFISPVQIKSIPHIDYPKLCFDEMVTVNGLLSDIKGKFDKLVFLGFEGVETKRTCELFNASPEAGAFLFEKMLFTPGTNIFSGLLRFLDRSALENKLVVISSHNVLPYFAAAVFHLELKVPEDVSVLYFKHYSSDYEILVNKYDSIERDFVKLGEVAADMMEDMIEKKRKGMDIYSVPAFEIKSVLKKRRSIR